jgi:hypothetical protein
MQHRLPKAEWPAILRWMIDGCLAWQRDGLVQPKVVSKATEEYFTDQDALRQGRGTLRHRDQQRGRHINIKQPVQELVHLGHRQWRVKPYRTTKSRGFLGIEAKPEPVQQHWSQEL